MLGRARVDPGEHQPVEAPTCRGALAVPDADHLWRQARDQEDYVHWCQTDDDKWIPRLRVTPLKQGGPMGLQFNPDLSVVWREHLATHSLAVEHLVDITPERTLIFETSAEVIRSLRAPDGRRFYVAYTPTDDEPLGCSHASILELFDKKANKAASMSLRTDLSEALSLVYGTFSGEIPEGA